MQLVLKLHISDAATGDATGAATSIRIGEGFG